MPLNRMFLWLVFPLFFTASSQASTDCIELLRRASQIEFIGIACVWKMPGHTTEDGVWMSYANDKNHYEEIHSIKLHVREVPEKLIFEGNITLSKFDQIELNHYDWNSVSISWDSSLNEPTFTKNELRDRTPGFYIKKRKFEDVLFSKYLSADAVWKRVLAFDEACGPALSDEQKELLACVRAVSSSYNTALETRTENFNRRYEDL